VTARESLPTDLAAPHTLILAERAARVEVEARVADARAEAANAQAGLSGTEAIRGDRAPASFRALHRPRRHVVKGIVATIVILLSATGEAVTAFREALKERPRERVPIYWARSQNNLGLALSAWGSAEAGRRSWKRRSPAFARPSKK
jgi:hypothetical protein